MSEPVCFSSDLIEVFSTPQGKVYQSDRESCLFIDFAGKFCRFSLRHFCTIRHILSGFDIEALLLDPYSAPVEIISWPGCEHCYVLTLAEIAAFNELLSGTSVMFELNHILSDRLHRIIA